MPRMQSPDSSYLSKKYSMQNLCRASTNSLSSSNERHRSSSGMLSSPSLQIHETASHILVTAELVDYDETTIDIWIEQNNLTLSADRSYSQRTQPGHRLVPSSFFKSVHLPATVDEDTVQATVEDEILTISMKKMVAPISMKF